MQKRGFADHFSFGQSGNDPFETDASAGDWNSIVVSAIGARVSPAADDLYIAPVFADGLTSDTASEGPDAAAAGGKKTTGGGTTSGSGGSTGGGTTSGG